MAMSNRERVGKGLEILQEALGDYLRSRLKAHFGRGWFVEGVEPHLTGTVGIDAIRHEGSDDEKFAKLDVQALLIVMWNNWRTLFAGQFGHSERSYVSELREVRNQWAHQQPFSTGDALRALDTMHRLLTAIRSPRADEVGKMVRDLQLVLLREEERKLAQQRTLEPTRVEALAHLKPWREVATPHDDVAQGRFQEAEFACDLAQVIAGEAEPEYQDPTEFFRRTYLTEGLREVLKLAILRLTGKGGAPVVQLQTSFGGGKTHTMLALYHLFGGEVRLSEVPDLAELVREVDEDLPVANRAVIVGTKLSPTEPRTYPDGVVTHTLWGEIAYQLGGKEAYELVRREDETGIAPGSDKVKELLFRYGPALILIDEWVAFARNLYHPNADLRLPAGSFDANLTFVQTLTEGAKRVKDALVVASIPQSDIEVGGEGGRAALERLQHTFGRLETIWKPATREESMEIVRRRLFKHIDEEARDKVVREFMAFYRNNRTLFPSHVQEREYERRFRMAYPIHPELFDRLYEDWSTLERFQRTRGVLRFMALVIHRLWQVGDRSVVILPGTLPLDSQQVASELTKVLEYGWHPVLDADVDGEQSRAHQLDLANPHFGRLSACRRVARTIFLGTAPHGTQTSGTRGIEEGRILLGCVLPGEQVHVFGDALRRLQEELTYLYADGRRYWFSTRATVNRVAQERAGQWTDQDVEAEIIRRLREHVKREKGSFHAVHVAPYDGQEVPDEPAVRLVILPPREAHRKGLDETRAIQLAARILEERGNMPRLYRNMLVFLATDAARWDSLAQAVRLYLAWKSVEEDSEQLNLDMHQQHMVKSQIRHWDQTVNVRLQEAYDWLLVPTQDGIGPVQWEALRLAGTGGENLAVRAGHKMEESGHLVLSFHPQLLAGELQAWLWRDNRHLPIQEVWTCYARYLYLSRLRDASVLKRAVEEGLASKEHFGYAKAAHADGTYEGFVYGIIGAQVSVENGVLIRPDVARAYAEALKKVEEQYNLERKPGEGSGSSTNPGGSGGGAVDPPGPGPGPEPIDPPVDPPIAPPPPKVRRLNLFAHVPPERLIGKSSEIFHEVLTHLLSLDGAEVEVNLDITVRIPNGLPDHVQRVINENARVLGVQVVEYEE